MLRNLSLAALLIFSFLRVTTAGAATITVPEIHSDLASALAAVQPGDVISLGPGTYYASNLLVPPGITLVGTGTSPDQVILDARGSGRILLCEGLDQTTTIRNITFTNGKATGSTSYDQSGGAIYCSNSNVSIIDCNFFANEADSHGGAIRCTNSSPRITNCTFIANSATAGGGGAIDCSYNSSPLLEDCTFLINKAGWGGALSCRDGSSPEIHETTFDGNSAAGNQAFGGAVFADYEAKPSFHETTFSDNSAGYGGAAACLAGSEINLVQCTVAGNTSLEQGGGLFIFDASPQINGSLITFNEGTGISTAGTAYPVINCTDIYGNSLGDWVGTIAGQGQTGGNLSVDPLYCSQAPGDDSRFFLLATSPVIQNDCGLMGAKPVVCDLTLTGDPLPPGPGLGTVAAWPNPFNPVTTIKFEIELPQRVRVTVFNLQGARVRTLADREFDKGTQNIQWNGEDEGGRMIGSGTYILVVEGRHDRQSRKLTMLK